MKYIIMLFAFISVEARAFHAVSEILPGGQLLICKDFGQVKKGSAGSDKIILPNIGQTINLYHRDFHIKRKVSSEFHEQKLGTASVVDASTLIGQERMIKNSPKVKSQKFNPQKAVITKEDAVEIERDCIVAVTENKLDLDELASVDW